MARVETVAPAVAADRGLSYDVAPAVDVKVAGLRVLFLVSAHNSLSQRVWTELTALGHEVTVAVVSCALEMETAVAVHRPELIVCPMLKAMIPESIWARHRCLIVHPGPLGDRGPSSLDWAIELGIRSWGVTVLEANAEPDAGQVWATRSFFVRDAGKSSLYRHEVRRAATEAVREALDRLLGDTRAVPASSPGVVSGRARPLMTQDVRAIDWRADRTQTVVRKLRAAEGHPGVRDTVQGIDCFLFGVHRESELGGRPGEIIAQRHGAICRATVDGAVWITHLKRCNTPSRTFFKLPGARTLALAGAQLDVPEIPAPIHAALPPDHTYRDIVYEERSAVGYLHFDFYNGAMSTEQCRRLHSAFRYARARSRTRVIVLTGGGDFFSNGIHLNVIEAADHPAAESWENLNAIDDLVREVIATDSHLVISAVGGDAAAGGVPLALAADYMYAREDTVLNPYYRHMGGLYGSEYWTYLLPRRVGRAVAARLTRPPFAPLSAARAAEIGLLDAAFGATAAEFHARVGQLAAGLADGIGGERRLELKRERRAADEQAQPLHSYRRHELDRCHECFFGTDRSYHNARRRFVYKLGAPCAVTPTDAASRRPPGGTP
jgi:putative two-component system protein, hydrogenase maturation factor HypX/HoxX